ncbi:MAG TPA: CBS domain-containing protein, partial [Cryomorphaceae bacterium]|nr:CBS domain-containing protein [Cryomorphaceae bacterium]
DVVVVLFHDHGSRYVGKVYNDDWMRDRGFLNERNKSALDLVNKHGDKPLITVGSEEPLMSAISKMKQYDISQIPVVQDGAFVGSVDEHHIFDMIVDKGSIEQKLVKEVMSASFPIVDSDEDLKNVMKLVDKNVSAVLVKIDEDKHHIITRHDLISSLH